MSSELSALLALAGLLLLPGLLAVRAPWGAVPLISLAFWLLTWWLPTGAAGRSRFLLAALFAAAALALLRALRGAEVLRPGGGVLLVLAAAGARMLVFTSWPVAPGLEMSFVSLEALLLTWRDGVPATHQPLLLAVPFGVVPSGAASLAADVSLLSGLAAHRAVLLVSGLALASVQVAHYWLLRSLFGGRPRLAAVSVLSLGAASVGLGAGCENALFAGALLLGAGALLLGHRGRPSAVVAGVLAAAATACDPLLVAAGLALGAVSVARGFVTAERAHACGWALVVAVSPLIWRQGLGATGLAWWVSSVRVLVVLLATALISALVLSMLDRSRLLAAVLWGLLSLAALAGSVGHYSTQARQLPDRDGMAALTWLRNNAPPLGRICSAPGSPGAWVPAVAGRRVSAPHLPGVLEHFAGSQPAGPCAFELRRIGPADPDAGRVVFRRGAVLVLRATAP